MGNHITITTITIYVTISYHIKPELLFDVQILMARYDQESAYSGTAFISFFRHHKTPNIYCLDNLPANQYYLRSVKRSLALQQCNQARDSRSKATNVAEPVVKCSRLIKLDISNVSLNIGSLAMP